MGGHEDEFIEAAIFKMDFSKPAQSVDMEKSRFFADFADGGLFRGLAGFDVAFRNRPAVFAVLNQKDFNILLIFREAKNDTAGGWLADNFLDDWFSAKNSLFELVDR